VTLLTSVPQYKNIEICGAPVIVCIIMTSEGEGVGATVILMGDAEGAFVTGGDEGASVTG
jgi:hypothetical protein